MESRIIDLYNEELLHLRSEAAEFGREFAVDGRAVHADLLKHPAAHHRHHRPLGRERADDHEALLDAQQRHGRRRDRQARGVDGEGRGEGVSVSDFPPGTPQKRIVSDR